MESFFTSLSKRQTMLLLTAVTFGGQDCLESFDFLTADEAELMKYRAQEMLQIAREKRIPLLVTEIKRLINSRRGMLWALDPARLAEVLREERPAVVEVLLRAFPEGVAERVRALLPDVEPRFRKEFEILPQILNILRWKLEEKLLAGRQASNIKFSDVIWLQRRELFSLCDHIGARTTAQALASLPEEKRVPMIQTLPPDLRHLIKVALDAPGLRKLDEKDAEELLAMHEAPKSLAEAIRSAGVQRLARACLAQSAEFAALMLERYSGDFGIMLGKWVREERQRAVNRGDGGRKEVVEELWRLEERGIVSKPVRLPPPTKKDVPPVKQPPRISLPNLKKIPEPALRPPPATLARPDRRPLLGPPPASLQKRDWVALREARKAGLPDARESPAARRAESQSPAASKSDVTAPLPQVFPDAVAQRRKSMEDQPVITSPATMKIPQRKGPAGVGFSKGSPPAHGTNVARPPRSRGEMAAPVLTKPPGRGPKNGSD